jgi:A/G-specific adenine glycosylase
MKISSQIYRFFETKIEQFFKEHGRKNLPWRKENITPYEVWISEIMLQQTQVNRVVPFYEKCIQRFPTVFDLAKVSWEEFLPYYEGLGYYRRGQNILKTARLIVEKYQGVFPCDKKLLMELPGIGEYTSSAILSFGYRKNFLPVDTNVHKVFGRFFAGKKGLDKDVCIENFTLPHFLLGEGIMDFANTICLKKPLCKTCPLQSQCIYAKENGKQEYEPKIQSKAFPLQEAQVYICLHRDHKEYYSDHLDHYTFFKLPIHIKSRSEIKEYFLKQYQIRLSVRPPYKKIFIQKEPSIFVYAQILSGQNNFGIFSTIEKQEHEKTLITIK